MIRYPIEISFTLSYYLSLLIHTYSGVGGWSNFGRSHSKMYVTEAFVPFNLCPCLGILFHVFTPNRNPSYLNFAMAWSSNPFEFYRGLEFQPIRILLWLGVPIRTHLLTEGPIHP